MGATDYIHVYKLPRMLVRGVNATLGTFLANLDGTGAPAVDPDSYALFAGSRLVFETSAVGNGIGPAVGNLSTTIAAADTEDEGLTDAMVEKWSSTITGELAQIVFTRPVYLVREVLHAVITDADLTALHSDLGDLRDPDQGTFQVQREDAFIVLQKWLIQKGNRPQLIVDDWQLRDVHRYLSLENVFRDFASSVGDGRYRELADHYRAKATDEFASLSLTYDFDESGGVDPEEVSAKAANPVTLLTVPWGYNDGW